MDKKDEMDKVQEPHENVNIKFVDEPVLDTSNNHIVQDPPSKSKIKHLVIAGGGPSGLNVYGALRKSHEMSVWSIDDIESIHGTSMGSLLAVFFALKYDWQTIDDYLIKRPWHHIIKYDMQTIFAAFSSRGVFDKKVFEETFRPLFSGLDISMNITMEEFYNLTKIEIHAYTTDINEFCIVDISYKTHPSWTVIEAVYASCCLPVIFTPFEKDGKYYVDGGIFLNYPLEPCIKTCQNTDEILGVRKHYVRSKNDTITETSNLMDYVFVLLNQTLKLVTKDVDHTMIKHEIVINSSVISIMDLLKIATSEEDRTERIQLGVQEAERWLSDNLFIVQEKENKNKDNPET